MYNNGLLLQHYIKKSLSCCFIFSLCLSVGVIIQCVLHKVDVDVVADVGRRFCRSWTAPHQERIHHTHTSLLSSSSSRFFGIAPSFPRLYVLNTYTHLYVRVGSYHTMGGSNNRVLHTWNSRIFRKHTIFWFRLDLLSHAIATFPPRKHASFRVHKWLTRMHWFSTKPLPLGSILAPLGCANDSFKAKNARQAPP